ncbi:MAG TPA: galactonate dehydratase, partial [Chloroflexota bacterium]|nr:galactonate dehydratase [Chloroflexota bacterium]
FVHSARQREGHVQITGLKTFVVNSGSSNWVFVKLYTDQPGLEGLGEGTVASKALTIAAAIEEHERYLVGKDPRNIELLWQAMYRYPRWRGGPVLNSAISAIEMALWDIKGKELGQPVWQLLGGAARERIRCYAHASPHSESGLRRIQELCKMGYTAIKSGPFSVRDGVVHPTRDVREGAAAFMRMREIMGEDRDILIDAHGLLTPSMAIDFARQVAPARPMWIEEITQPEDLTTLAWVAERSPVPLATGERLFTKWGFNDLIQQRAVQYIQPDVSHDGGILETKKIAAMAEVKFIEVALHGASSEVLTAANFHVDATTPNCTIQEHPLGSAWRYDLIQTPWEVKEGYALLSNAPGLGIELNEAEAAKHPYQEDFRAQYTFSDGSVADA